MTIFIIPADYAELPEANISVYSAGIFNFRSTLYL